MEALHRIEPEHKHKPAVPPYRATFFSEHDIWLYQAVIDSRVCPICTAHEETERFYGNHLRSTFPYLEIIDVQTIKVNAHPNCRCFLSRLIEA